MTKGMKISLDSFNWTLESYRDRIDRMRMNR